MNEKHTVSAARLNFQLKAWLSRTSPLSQVLCLLLLSQILLLPVEAVQRTWVSTGNRFWSPAGNWSPAGTPQNGDSLLFIDNGAPDVMTNDISGLTVSGMQFNKGKTLYGQALSTTGDIIQNNVD